MELGQILGRNLENLENGKIWAFFKVFQGLIFYFCRFPGFSRFSRSPGNPVHNQYAAEWLLGGGGVQQQKRQRTSCDFPGGMIFFVLFCSLLEDILLTKSGKNNKKEH